MKKIAFLLFFLLLPAALCRADETELQAALEASLHITADCETYETAYGHALYWNDGVTETTAILDENNRLISVDRQTRTAETRFRLPQVSRQTAVNTAAAFVQAFAADVLDQLDTEQCTVTYNKSIPYGYQISFVRTIRQISYPADQILVFIDGATGEILRYGRSFSADVTVPAFAALLDMREAQERFRAGGGLELRYNTKIEDGQTIPYLVYAVRGNYMINAETGNVVSTDTALTEDLYFDVTSMYEKTTSAISGAQSVLRISEADGIARAIPELELYDDYTASQAYYLKNAGGAYLLVIEYANASGTKTVTLNAQTGLLVEYSSSAAASYPAARPVDVPAFIEQYYGSYLPNMYRAAADLSDGLAVLYERQADGIPYKSNGLYIRCDTSGRLASLSFAWDDVELAPPQNIISEDEAYDLFFRRCGLELLYYKRTNNTLTPVYTKHTQGTGIIDAYTGYQLNYDGTRRQPVKALAYTDFETHYARTAAAALSECDVYVSSGNVRLSDPISQQDFLLLISDLLPETKPVLDTTGSLTESQQEMLYTYMITAGVLERSEVNPGGTLTRANAVKYFLRVLGYGSVADLHTIFKPHFLDHDQLPAELLGYVELARGLKLVVGSDDGRFNPNEQLSNGDSLIMMYNYLKQEPR